MTPLYLNPPPSPFSIAELKEDQNLQFFLQPNQPISSSSSSSTSLSNPVFFNRPQEHQKVITELGDDHKDKSYVFHHGGSSDHCHVVHSSSSLQNHMVVDDTYAAQLKLSLCREDGSDRPNSENSLSVKWMSSKMRLMGKMVNSNCSMDATITNKPQISTKKTSSQIVQHHNDHDQINQYNNNITSSKSRNSPGIRFCSDCNTTTTPLWRSGPRGPKSLCNACGIRQRKARRALELAGNGKVVPTEVSPSMKIKVQNKEKKSRINVHVNSQFKKQFKSQIDTDYIPPRAQKKVGNNYFKDFALSLSKSSAFGRVFPRDEEEAAILLMELSAGLIHG